MTIIAILWYIKYWFKKGNQQFYSKQMFSLYKKVIKLCAFTKQIRTKMGNLHLFIPYGYQYHALYLTERLIKILKRKIKMHSLGRKKLQKNTLHTQLFLHTKLPNLDYTWLLLCTNVQHCLSCLQVKNRRKITLHMT